MNVWENTWTRNHYGEKLKNDPIPPSYSDNESKTENRGLILRIDIDDHAESESIFNDVDSNFNERQYGKANRDFAKKMIEISGFEAIAFYCPIHFYGTERWGVYIHEKSFFGICAEIAAILGGSNWDSIVDDMILAIKSHEGFHAAVEMFCSILEDFARLGCGQQRTAIVEQNIKLPKPYSFPDTICPYLKYYHEIYKQNWPNENCIEETLASSFEMRCIYKTKGFKKTLTELLSNAPKAYRQWAKFEDKEAAEKGIQELAYEIQKKVDIQFAITDRSRRVNRELWFPDTSIRWLDSKGPIPYYVYREDSPHPSRFRAPLGNIRLKDFLKGLKRHYNVKIDTGGKHRAVTMPNGKKLAFPVKKVLPIYLVGETARALGVDRKELLSKCLGISV